MAVTPIGTNVVSALSRRYIMPEIIDAIYNDNPITYRLLKQHKKVTDGSTHIELPFMYKRFTHGGPYRGFQLIPAVPEDTVKNGAWEWKQYAVTVAVDGYTLLKVDSAQAVANFLRFYFEQAKIEMMEILAEGIWSNGTNDLHIDGIEMAVDDGGVSSTYANLTRSANTYLNAVDDSTTTTLTLAALNSWFMNCKRGGRNLSVITSRVEQYLRYWNLLQPLQNYPTQYGVKDEQMANAGFTNLGFNNVPWIIDSHVFDGANTSNSAIVGLNEDYWELRVHNRADMFMQDFQVPVEQDAMVAKILWAGNLICKLPSRNGKMTAIVG